MAFNAHAQPQNSQLTIFEMPALSVSGYALHGPVKTLKEDYFQIFNDDSKMSGGFLISTFDTLGLLVEKTNKTMIAGFELGTRIFKYKYDKNGRILSEENWGIDNPEQKEIISYHMGATGEMQSMDKINGDRTERTEYTFTTNHLLAVKKIFRQKETVPYRVQRFSYDDQNRVTARVEEDNDKKTIEKHLFSYILDYTYFSSESMDGGAMLYPATGVRRYEYIYNETGRLLKKIKIGENGNQSTNSYTYEYDETGNWTKQTESGTGALQLVDRTIIYHQPTSPQGIYEKAIREGIDPTLKTLEFIIKSATGKTQLPEQILKNIATLAVTVKADKKYVQSIKDLPGNNAKELSMEFLNYIAAPKMQTDLILIVADPVKNNPLVESNMKFLQVKLAAIGAELLKLH